MYPVPVEARDTPSTNTSSPGANSAVENPRNGVVRVQVAIPCTPLCIELIPTPFELLIEISLCGSDWIPNSGPSCSTSAIAPFGALAMNVVVSITCLVVSLNRIRPGSLRYLEPPDSISILLIVSRLSISTIGGTSASGLRVLSE